MSLQFGNPIEDLATRTTKSKGSKAANNAVNAATKGHVDRNTSGAISEALSGKAHITTQDYADALRYYTDNASLDDLRLDAIVAFEAAPKAIDAALRDPDAATEAAKKLGIAVQENPVSVIDFGKRMLGELTVGAMAKGQGDFPSIEITLPTPEEAAEAARKAGQLLEKTTGIKVPTPEEAEEAARIAAEEAAKLLRRGTPPTPEELKKAAENVLNPLNIKIPQLDF